MLNLRKLIRKKSVSFLVWIGYSLGLWKSITSSKKYLKKKDLMSEFMYLYEVCYLTCLNKDYLKKSVKNRICGSILILIERFGGEVFITSKEEELKKLIENTFSVKIEKNDSGYYLDNNGIVMKSFWSLDLPKDFKRDLELLFISIELSNNQGN